MISVLAKQILWFNKMAFYNAYNGLTVLQESFQSMMEENLRHCQWISDENRKPYENSMEIINKVREDYRNLVDQGFLNLEKMTCAKKR